MSDEDFYIYRRCLPHWRLGGATYFITWRVEPLQADLAPEERTLVVSALRYFDDEPYELTAHVVMNDHLHALVKPLRNNRLQDILHSWKSYTTWAFQRTTGRVGSVWQEEYF